MRATNALFSSIAILLLPLALLQAADPAEAPDKAAAIAQKVVGDAGQAQDQSQGAAGNVPVNVDAVTNGSAPTYVIKQVDAGKDRLEIIDPAFSKKATEAERQRYLHEVLFPKLKSDAVAGREPAAWEIGFFYLNGWGVAEDLQKAEAAFRIGLQHKQGHGAWRLGWVFYDKACANKTSLADVPKYLAKAEELLRAALEAGFKRAVAQVSIFSRVYIQGVSIHGKPCLKTDFVKAQSLLDVISAVAPSHPRYLLSVAMLRLKQERYAEAFDAASRSLPGLKQRAKVDKGDSDYDLAAVVQCVAAFKIGKLAELKPEELMVFVKSKQVDLHPEPDWEPLLQAIGKVAPDNPCYFKLMGDLRCMQKRPAEAFHFYWSSLPGLKQQAIATHDPGEYEYIQATTLLIGVSSGALFQKKPDEVMELIPKLPPMTSGLVVFGMLTELAGLVLWTYRTRQRGPGLLLSAAWMITALLAAGMGFVLPFSGLHNTAGHWIGALMAALACFIAVWVSGRERYFGTGPIFPSFKSTLRGVGVVAAIFVGVTLYGYGYEFLSVHLFGKKTPPQLVELLMRWDTTAGFITTLLVVGVAIPFYEEVCFRGFMFDALLRRWGGGWALGLTSLVFALAHGLTFAPRLLFLAVALGWLRLRSGNLRLSILLHSMNNCIAAAVLYFLKL